MTRGSFWKIAVSLLTLTAGCGHRHKPALPLSPEARIQVRGAVRIHAVHPDRRIRTVELVYKVLWNEFRFTSFATEGLWNPGPLMEKRLMAVLGSRTGIDGTPLRHQLDDAGFAAFQRSVAEGIERATREVGATGLLGPVGEPYLSMKSRGIDYVLELILDDVTFTPTCLIDRLEIHATGRLIRISDGRVLWAERGVARTSVSGVDYFSDLTKGDFALLRERFDEAMKLLLSPSSPFLEGLALPDQDGR